MRLRPAVRPAFRSALLVLPVLLFALACAPEDDASDDADDPATSESSEPTEEPTDEPSASESASESTAPTLSPECADPTQLPVKKAGSGFLTVGTDSPAYEPWFADDDPTNGQGFESAVAYALAGTLGMQIEWVTVPFNSSYKPGPKDFDFDINQISITPARAEVVDFSDPYFSLTQAVIALEGTPVADVTSIAELADYNLGAQTGTTSLTAIREIVKPANDPAVFEDTNAAKQALVNGQVDAIVADIYTAFYISSVEIKGSLLIGQFEDVAGQEEQFGLLFEKGNPLVACVNEALAVIEADGTLEQLEQQWLSTEVDVPVLQ